MSQKGQFSELKIHISRALFIEINKIEVKYISVRRATVFQEEF